MARKENGRLRELKARSDRGEITAVEYMAAKRRIENTPPNPQRVALVGKILGVAVGLVLAVFLVTTWETPDAPDPRAVYATRYGNDWPFPFQEATVRCEMERFGDIRRPVVTMKTSDGIVALNGVARALKRYKDYQDYLPKDSAGIFTKGPNTVSALISAGTRICGSE